ncbi:MAG: amino acid ABC transporter permease [Syntrophomonadaceae bacterium]|nr:amino acid ABC transporter permease [Syntrophomonadaceae bacterium]
MFDNFGQQLYNNFILFDRWQLYLSGLGNTLLITFGAALIGIVLGSLVAICKVYARDNPKLKPLDIICDIYLTVIRGTPMMVQVMIFGFIIFATVSFSKMVYVAMLAFGINSGAYVAEIVRAGIQSIDIGQTEAGRSLGLTKNMTMRYIILPQAIRNILPALGNEAIVLLKETAIVGYIAISDLTYQATLIRSRTFSPAPLLIIAVAYLALVMLMTVGLRFMERKLAQSDHR